MATVAATAEVANNKARRAAIPTTADTMTGISAQALIGTTATTPTTIELVWVRPCLTARSPQRSRTISVHRFRRYLDLQLPVDPAVPHEETVVNAQHGGIALCGYLRPYRAGCIWYVEEDLSV